MVKRIKRVKWITYLKPKPIPFIKQVKWVGPFTTQTHLIQTQTWWVKHRSSQILPSLSTHTHARKNYWARRHDKASISKKLCKMHMQLSQLEKSYSRQTILSYKIQLKALKGKAIYDEWNQLNLVPLKISNISRSINLEF